MKYKLIKNFFTNYEVDLCSDYMGLQHRTNNTKFDFNQSHGDTAFYGDMLFDVLLMRKTKVLESEINIKLLPTYSFWRCYSYNSILKNHKDRPACEFSVSVHIDSSGERWPFIVDGKEFYLNQGDGLFYKGNEVFHSRPTFYGDFYLQTFLHYVNAEGEFADHIRDKRSYLGTPKV
jgi:hypothetical protein